MRYLFLIVVQQARLPDYCSQLRSDQATVQQQVSKAGAQIWGCGGYHALKYFQHRSQLLFDKNKVGPNLALHHARPGRGQVRSKNVINTIELIC